MLKLLLHDSVSYSIANAIQKIIPIAIIPLVTAHLGENGLKVYDVSFVYAYLFSWLVILGQDAAASVYYFDETKQNFDKGKVISNAFFLQCCSFLLFFLAFVPFKTYISNVLFPNDAQIAAYWVKALLIIPGQVVFNYALNILLWKRKKGAYIFLCSIQAILSVSSVYLFVVFKAGNMAQLFDALIFSISITGLASLFFIGKNIFVNPFPLDQILIRRLLFFGLPLCLTAFFQQLLPAIDRFFLLHYQHNSELAQYILAVKMGAVVNLGISAFVLAFTPYSLKKLNEPGAEKQLSELFTVISTAAFILVPVALIFKDVLIGFFADSSYQLSGKLLPFFFFAWVFDLFTYFSMLGAYKKQRSGIVLVMFILSTGLIAILNLALIPQFGVYGAAVSFCITKIALFLTPLLYFRKYFKLDIDTNKFLLAFSIAAVCSYLLYRVDFAWFALILLVVIVITVLYLRKLIRKSSYLFSFEN
jgi:O-antigen/teichoic acid export membrane protein